MNLFNQMNSNILYINTDCLSNIEYKSKFLDALIDTSRSSDRI